MVRATSAGLVYTNSEYYADLANAATYTPPANFRGVFLNEDGFLDGNRFWVEAWDGAGWVNVTNATAEDIYEVLHQGINQTLRVTQQIGVATKFWLVGVIWG